jgi:transglutaminase-like putative cysteine protease
MNIHAPLDDRAYTSRLWWVMVAGCAARFTAERSTEEAWLGFVLWTAIFAACRFVRARLVDASAARRQQAGNFVAIAGLALLLLEMNRDGLVPGLLVFLFAIESAVFITATKRLHAWLILGAALGGVLFAAAESRSSVFLVCAVWFTFASLGLLAVDHRHDREQAMLLLPLGPTNHRTGGIQFAAVALLCTLPVYLFVPKPQGMMLGGLTASAAHDYRQDSRSADSRQEESVESDESLSPSTDDRRDEPTRRADNSEPARPQEGDYGDNFSIDDVQRSGKVANTIVMYVKSSRPINLRGLVYDRFENHRWYRGAQPFQDLELVRGNLELHGSPAGGNDVRQTIEIVRDMGTTLVHAPGVRRVRFPAPALRRYDDDVFVIPQPLRAPTTYSIESSLALNDGRYSLPAQASRDLGRYLDATMASDRVRALASEVTAGVSDPRAKAVTLENFLRTEYRFSYETIARQGYTPLDWFLFEGKQGHCEYFASSLAILLRTVGIPSRVATGFSLSAPNPVTGYYEVRALDGHAWVEALIDGQWLMFEPTPFYPLPMPGADRQVADQLDSYLDRLARTNAVVDPTGLRTRMSRVASTAWHTSREVLRRVSELPRQLGWFLPMSLLLGATAIALAYLAVMAAADWLANKDVRSTLTRATSADARQATLMSARALQDTTAPRGVKRREAASFREYLGELDEVGSAVPARFADDFDAARYGLGDVEVASDTTREIRQIIESHLATDPWPRARRTLAVWRRWIAERVRRD